MIFYPIIWWKIVSLIFAKWNSKIVVKDLTMLDVQSEENLLNKLFIFIAEISQIIIFNVKVNFEK
jgi:hypothetical protein